MHTNKRLMGEISQRQHNVNKTQPTLDRERFPHTNLHSQEFKCKAVKNMSHKNY